MLNIPAADVRIRPELLALLPHAGLKPDDLITLDDLALSSTSPDKLDPSRTHIILTDHNSVDGPLGAHFGACATGCVDHHADEHVVPVDAQPRVIEKAGSCSSLVVQHLRVAWDALSLSALSSGAAHGQDDAVLGADDAGMRRGWDAQVAKLALASILVDTVNMSASKKVERSDEQAVAYLLGKIALAGPAKGGVFERDGFFKEINDAKSNLEALSADEALRKDYKQWAVGTRQVGIASVVKRLSWLKRKTDEASADFAETLKRFAKQRDLDVMAVMTANAEGGEFKRELLLYPCKASSKGIVEEFEGAAGKEFGLAEHENVADGEFRIWWQTNLASSRKQVGPRLREVMASTPGHRM